jgi:DNA-binding NtrC family response regulator
MTKKSVLIIEDESTTKLLYKEAFKDTDLNVLWAGDGFTAIEIIKRTTIDLVLTDIRLPLGGGKAVLSHLSLYHPELPVVIVTGFPEEKDDALDHGANVLAFFSKPVDLDTLKQVIAPFL